MLYLILLLGTVGLVFSINGLYLIFFAKQAIISSRLSDILALGFFLAAIKSVHHEAYLFKVTGWKRVALGIVFLLAGIFLMSTAYWVYETGV